MRKPTPGKVPIEFLKKFVFGKLGASRDDVVQGPGVGRDFAATKRGDVWIISASDPVTGSQALLGKIAVNVATNDVSMSGIRPAWLSLTALMPMNFTSGQAEKLFGDISAQASELEVAIVGGHTEYVSYIARPIVIATAMGASSSRPKMPSDARPGDLLLLAGDVGIEGTAILATEIGKKLLGRGVPRALLSKARSLIGKTSVMKVAMRLAEFETVRSLHDPTEGGLVGGLYEMSVASGLGFEADLDDVPIRHETQVIADKLKLDPCKLISSGAILASCSPSGADEILREIGRSGVKIMAIGEFKASEGERVIIRRGKRLSIKDAPTDELWRAIC